MLPLAMAGRRNLSLAFGKEGGARGKGGHIPISQGLIVRRTRWVGQRDIIPRTRPLSHRQRAYFGKGLRYSLGQWRILPFTKVYLTRKRMLS